MEAIKITGNAVAAVPIQYVTLDSEIRVIRPGEYLWIDLNDNVATYNGDHFEIEPGEYSLLN